MKLFKIISLALGGMAVVAGGIIMASKLLHKRKMRKYQTADSIEDIIYGI